MITLTELKENFIYVHTTGDLFRCDDEKFDWSLSNGYWRVLIDGKIYLVHRIAWFMYYGVWPTQQIDHINRIKTDNRIINLRDVSAKVNVQNIIVARKDNKTGLRGVKEISPGLFVARIRTNGEVLTLGKFNSADKAFMAYKAAKLIYHEGYVDI